MTDVLDALHRTLEQRKSASADSSYVASLHAKGLNKILEKVAEEAAETLLAAKDYQGGKEERASLIGEVADLWFHTMVMLSHLELSHEDVMKVLEARFGLSGLVEKAGRDQRKSPSTP